MPTYAASITPFDPQGRIDLPAVARLLAWFRAAGLTGVVFAGTNGEGPSLSPVEKRDLLRDAIPLAEGLEIILGIATSSLDEAVWSCKQAHAAGAKAALVMPPSYFREASDDGIAQWFEALFDRSPAGIFVYNFPRRTGVTLSADLMGRLARHPRMLGLKDSSGEAANLPAYREALADSGRSLFVGDETLVIEALKMGWTGTISGSANVLPGWIRQIVEEWPQERESAEAKYELILPAIRALRKAPQPAANKAILHRLGVIPHAEPRLPLLPISDTAIQPAWDEVSKLVK